jgi:hypothetical protein
MSLIQRSMQTGNLPAEQRRKKVERVIMRERDNLFGRMGRKEPSISNLVSIIIACIMLCRVSASVITQIQSSELIDIQGGCNLREAQCNGYST